MEGVKINKEKLLITVIILQLFIIVCGCFESTINDRFVGTWKTLEGGTVIFYSNGNCNFFGSNGKWELKDDLVLVTVPFSGGENTLGWKYNFSSDYKVLTLKNVRDEGYTLYKQ